MDPFATSANATADPFAAVSSPAGSGSASPFDSFAGSGTSTPSADPFGATSGSADPFSVTASATSVVDTFSAPAPTASTSDPFSAPVATSDPFGASSDFSATPVVAEAAPEVTETTVETTPEPVVEAAQETSFPETSFAETSFAETSFNETPSFTESEPTPAAAPVVTPVVAAVTTPVASTPVKSSSPSPEVASFTQESEHVKAWRAERDAQIQESRKLDTAAREASQSDAQATLDAFYDQLSGKAEAAHKKNSEEEALIVKCAKGDSENPWSLVAEMANVSKYVAHPDAQDLTIMRDLLITLKHA